MKTKQDVIRWIEDNKELFTRVSDEIWANPEICWKEFKASKLQADYLEAQGFKITWDVASIATAFVAEWGQGYPIIGFAGEYDALSGLSQKNQPVQEPLVEGGLGHGCGHNLLGTGCMATAAAVKAWLEATGTRGKVRYYGCPAEERGGGKTFMARQGAFDDLDAAFNFHPGHLNSPLKGSNVGVNGIIFRYHGTSSHAGSAPHLGRSALDAVELMNVGVNYLREHVPGDVRIHYVITKGGDAPNIVPALAEVWYYIRAHLPNELEDVTERVRKVAEGAALMTDTQVEEIFEDACTSILNNHHLADLQYEAMKIVGPIIFTDQEQAYAKKINDSYAKGTLEGLAKTNHLPKKYMGQALVGDNFPALDIDDVFTGSTDVGDLSWKAPVSMLVTTCWPSGAPAHTWGVVATGAMSIGHKGMLHAAKTMAVAALDLYSDPTLLKKVRQEFEKAINEFPYKCPLPDHIQPPSYKQEA